MPKLSRKDVIELANSYMMTNVSRWWEDDPIVIESGKGAVLRDMDGREYIDLHSMHAVASQGYSHPKIIQAVKEQLEK
ncbi:MAG: aminotransferase class III-fold pyridoxal phosphate-dependent enzyme, partial [Candidatus Korarchaeum sp.]